MTGTQILDFLCKANQIGISTTVTKSKNRYGFLIQMDYDWLGIGSITREIAYVPDNGDFGWHIAQGEGATIDYQTVESLMEARILYPIHTIEETQ